jgi:HJR/Mrr/RecB family endonuclease
MIFIISSAVQIFLAPILFFPYSFIADFITENWYGREKMKMIKHYKNKVYFYNVAVERYNEDVRHLMMLYPDAIKYGNNLDQFFIDREKKRVEQEIALNERKKEKAYWLGLNGYQFEVEIANLYKKLGYKTTITNKSGDGGVDIVLFNDNKEKLIVQCKNHRKQVGPAVVRELYGVMISEKAAKAILICSGGFTSGVYTFAKNKPIKLLALENILDMNRELF